MDDTMRDLLSKLDTIIGETALKDKADLEAKRKALQDLQTDPVASKDPEISQAIVQRKADLEKEAKAKGFTESSTEIIPKGLYNDDDFYAYDPETMELKRSWSNKERSAIFNRREAEEKGWTVKKGSHFNYGEEKLKRSPAKSFNPFKKEEDVYQIADDFGISISEEFEIATEIVDILEDGIVVELDETAIGYLTKNGFTFEEVQLDEEKKKGVDGKACWKGYRYAGREKKADGSYKDKCVKVGESIIAEREHHGNMPADAVRTLYNIYQDASQGVKPHYDVEGADRIGKALDDAARELGVSKYMKSLYNSASNAAHMDFDTNPGGFENWFNYVGDHLKALYNIHKEKGSYDNDEPDFEVEKEDLEMEAKYQGREVPLGKPMKGDVKKSKVYVRGPKGNVVKVNFGDKKMRIKKSNPKRRKSFRARHNCSNPGPRWKARYWSCRAW